MEKILKSNPLVMNTSLKLHGLVAAAHTPFDANGNIAPNIVDLQAQHLVSQGVKMTFVTGSTGESSSLQLAERLEILSAWKEASTKHGITVISHIGGNSVRDGVELAAASEKLGLAATAALSPSYFKPGTPQALVSCCAEMASAAPSLPFYYYDIPVLTGVRFSMTEVMKLCSEQIPNFAGVKFTNPDLAHYMDALIAENGKYDVPWGVDEWFLGALATGAKGAVGSSFNFAPKLYLDLIDAFNAGDMETARLCQKRSVEMINILAARGYMGCAKAVMGWLGVPVGPARLPQGTPNESTLKELRNELTRIGFFEWSNK